MGDKDTVLVIYTFSFYIFNELFYKYGCVITGGEWVEPFFIGGGGGAFLFGNLLEGFGIYWRIGD